MKKLVLLLSVVLITLSFTACMANNTVVQEVGSLTIDEAVEAKPAGDYEKNLDGLCSYMEDNQLVGGNSLTMSFDFIGAENGVKYLYRYDKTQFSVELYEFDTENMNEKSTEVVNSIKENGYFLSLENQVEAVLSENGQFMMICIATKPDEAGESLDLKINQMFADFK